MTISVDYLLNSNSWGVRIGDASATGSSRGVFTLNQTGVDATGAYRIGGTIQAPRKISNVDPQYPNVARAAKVQGVVIIEARVDESGNISDTRVLRSIPLLDQAAVDAVKQWKYTPTLMNGVAVPIIMTVTVNFGQSNSGNIVRLSITMPDGQVTPRFAAVANGSIGIEVGLGDRKFGFAPLLHQGSSPDAVKVAIYDMTGAHSGVPPVALGSVEVTQGGGAVQSPTTPSFGIEVISVDTQ